MFVFYMQTENPPPVEKIEAYTFGRPSAIRCAKRVIKLEHYLQTSREHSIAVSVRVSE